MFYDTFLKLCKSKEVSPNKACIETGVSRTAVAKWKKGGLPNSSTISKLAEYFNVSVDYLLGNEKKPALDNESEPYKDELIAFYGAVKNELTEDDLADIKTLMRLRAEMRREKKGK